jgi:hypothetical protein
MLRGPDAPDPFPEDSMIRLLLRRRVRPAFPLVALILLAIVALAAPCVHATVPPEAQAVLDRYVQAMGGQAFLDAHTLHVKSTLSAFMMEGTAESWTVRPGRYVTHVEIGPLKLKMGFDGVVGWRTDPSGKVLRLDGRDLDETRGSAWFESDAYLLPDQGGGTVTWVGEESDSVGRYAVLDLTPPAGRPRRAYFDMTTGLMVKAVSKNDQQTVVNRFEDHRSVGGRKIAFGSSTEVVGQPMNTIRVTVDSAWVNEEMPPSLFEMPAGGEQALKYLKAEGVARLPFEYASHHVWLKASVNGGPPVDFIYDTGAGMSVIDSAYAAKIELETQGEQQGQGAGATGRVSFASLGSLRVESEDGDGIELSDVKVAVLNVNGILAPYFWRDCAGIIGFDFINRFVNEIDFDNQTLTLHDPQTFEYAGEGAVIPMTLAGHAPVVHMKLDDTYEGDFRVDVGSGSTVDLHTPFVKEHDLAAKAGRSVEVTGGGFGGTFKNRIVRMKKLEIGPYSWTEPLVSLSQATEGAFTSEDYAGNIGTRLLERFKVTLDYERRQMWLEPGQLYARRDPFTRAGVQLGRIDGTVRVMDVLDGSPAEKAGLRLDDVVVALDGKPISTLTPDQVSDVLDEGPPGTHTIEVLRNGKAKKIKVRLKEML